MISRLLPIFFSGFLLAVMVSAGVSTALTSAGLAGLRFALVPAAEVAIGLAGGAAAAFWYGRTGRTR